MPYRFATWALAACLLSLPALAQEAGRRPAPRLLVVTGAEIPVRLARASVEVDIGGGSADTTIELAFRNPNGRALEGELQFPLAPGQKVVGFALDIDGEMRPAVPVEKARGRQVFEEIARRGVDPGLLERTQGDNFRLRIYPLMPGGERRVRLRLAQPLARAPGLWSYRLPLAWAVGAADWRAAVRVHGATSAPALAGAIDAPAFRRQDDGYAAELPRSALAGGVLALQGRTDAAPRAWTGEFEDASYAVAEIPLDAAARPRALRKAVDEARRSQRAGAKARKLASVLRELQDKEAWWHTGFPLPAGAGRPGSGQDLPEGVPSFRPLDLPAPPPPPAPAASFAPPPAAPSGIPTRIAPMPLDAGRRLHGPAAGAEPSAPIGIALRKWTPDQRYLDRMALADGRQAYALYLDRKPDHSASSAFYLDVADTLFEKGARDLALRVLSNLAEMELENRQVLRVLGYRLMQAGAPELAVPVFEQVLRIAEDEPQSWRDLGLAHAAAGHPQQAVDLLVQVALRDWDARFSEIELVALADMNALVAANRGKVDTGRIDPRLLRHMPLDLRVLLSWDSDDSDMDLWVTGPDGERCYYANRFTRLGGRLSRDATGGYGPEEFSLRHARPGKYRIEANFFGRRQQIVAGATTLQLKLVTGFGTPGARERMVTLRLRGRGDTILVGEFEVPAGR